MMILEPRATPRTAGAASIANSFCPRGELALSEPCVSTFL
jgi:hypothetical protein